MIPKSNYVPPNIVIANQGTSTWWYQ